MPVFRDQIGRSFELKEAPRRIVSLVPSQTELLADMGLESAIVGVTKFCVHPAKLRSEKTLVGGTKNLHFHRIERLNPDLIIANKEENTRVDIESLAKKHAVYVSDIENINDAQRFALDIGALTGNDEKARKLISEIDVAVAQIKRWSKRRGSALYMIWKQPYMTAGTDSFISQMLNICGLQNVMHTWSQAGLRYPEVSLDQILELNPDIILLSSEPYPFKIEHAEELSHLTGIKTILVDGEIFSWYGTRILHTLPKFKSFIHHVSDHFQ